MSKIYVMRTHLLACNCHPDGTNGNMVCDATGQCTCSAGHTGQKCEKCKMGFYGFPACKDCECDLAGSVNSVCDESGLCSCKAGVGGDRCSRCMPNMFGFPNCQGINILHLCFVKQLYPKCEPIRASKKAIFLA